jgi:hypothetical protein
VATAKPKNSAAAFRVLLAKLVDLYVFRSEPQSTGAAAKAEASAARVEAQIKEICELASPGSGEGFILLFSKAWRSREDANRYLEQRNHMLVWLGEFAAAKRKPHIEKARQQKVDSKAHRNRQMVAKYIRREKLSPGVSATELKAEIGKVE